MTNNIYSGDIEAHKRQASEWFKSLQNNICMAFEEIERSVSSQATFTHKDWQRNGGGAGQMRVMKGEAFEKVGVNFSEVFGEFPPSFAKEIPGAEQDPNFWACGISLVAHMKNPKVPSVHFNTRMIVTKKHWFGGGADLTPTIEFSEDTKDFHNSFKSVCDKHNPEYYHKFKQWCDEYFFIKHRNEARGVGGIFYDYINSGSFANDFDFTKDVGIGFLEVFQRLVYKRLSEEFTKEDKHKQLVKRGRYAEFNLIYDRGTKFGLMTGGNVEAILMSLPPEAIWE